MYTSAGRGHLLHTSVTLLIFLSFMLPFAPASARSLPVAAARLAQPATPDSADEADVHVVLMPFVARGGSSRMVIGPDGGTLTLLDGKIQLVIPPGAFDEPTTVVLATTTAAPPNTPAKHYDFGIKLDIKAYNQAGLPVTQLKKSADLIFSYEHLEFWIYPTLMVMGQDARGYWDYYPIEYVSGKKQIISRTNHFSVFGLFGLNAIFFGRMAGDALGGLYVLNSLGDVYRYQPGSQQAQLYASLSLPYNQIGDLAYDPASGSLYIANGKFVYRLNDDKQLSTVYESSTEVVTGISYSVYYKKLMMALCAYPNQEWCRRSDIETDLRGHILESGYLSDHGIYEIKIRHQSEGVFVDSISGFLDLPGRMAMDQDDILYVANTNDNAITIFSGEKPVPIGAIRVPEPENVVVTGGSLAVFTQGGVKVFPKSRRDDIPGEPYSLTGDSISGKGIAMRFAGVASPAHTSLSIDGHIVRKISFYDRIRQVVTYDLALSDGDAYFPPKSSVYDSDKVYAYQEQFGNFEYYTLGNLSASGPVAVPAPGTIMVLSSSVSNLVRGQWGRIPYYQSICRVVSKDGLFPEWQRDINGSEFIYQFNQIGEFTFTVYGCNGEPGIARIVKVDAGDKASVVLRDYPVDPEHGAIIPFTGLATLEIPDGALPGTDRYLVGLTIVDHAYPGNDAVEAYSRRYSLRFQPEPDQLLKPIVLRLPYDPASVTEPPNAGYYDPYVDDVVLLDTEVANGYVNISFPVGFYEVTPETRSGIDSKPIAGMDIFGSINKIASNLRWAVGLPNQKAQDDHFTVLYNTKDVSEAYAITILDALNKTRETFEKEWTMPTNRVIVKVAPWVAAVGGSGATTSLLFNYHIFINDKLSKQDLQDTIAHEFFHVLQRKNLSVEGYLWTPSWWLEATATWAQWVIYPSHSGLWSSIYDRLDFPKTQFHSWGGLDEYRWYAAMALPAFLEHRYGSGTVRKVFENLSKATDNIDQCIATAAGFSFPSVYHDFAFAYWTQQYDPVSQWLLLGSENVPVGIPKAASNTIVQNPANSSSWLIMAHYDGSPNPPDSFDNATGSVVRMDASCSRGELYVFDKEGNSLGSLIGSVPRDQVISLGKIGAYTKNNPLYFLYINYEEPENTCVMRAYWETPTITSLYPTSLPANQQKTVWIHGNGFGPTAGMIHTSIGDFIPEAWYNDSIRFTPPAQVSAGTITIQVQLPSGELSNPASLAITAAP